MRHRKAGRKFGMDSSARKAMFRNMVTSLMVHGRIKTTQARAKELRGFAERMISVGKHAPTLASLEGLAGEELKQAKADRVSAIRRMKLWVNNDEAIGKLLGEYADRFRTRPGGYTRVVKVSRRRNGDNSEMAIIELVGEMGADAAQSPDEEPTVVGSTSASESASLA
jgi:large subunit ribosomal protein L17